LIAVAVVIAHPAALAGLFQLPATLFCLSAVFAVPADGLFQVVVCLANLATASVIAIRPGRRCHSRQQ